MRPLRLWSLVLFGISCAAFIALIIPGVVYICRSCTGDGGGTHNQECKTGVILTSVAGGMLLLALASVDVVLLAHETPAAQGAQAKDGRSPFGAQAGKGANDVVSFQGLPSVAGQGSQQADGPLFMYPPNALALTGLYDPAYVQHLQYADYPGAAARLEYHLASSQQLLWALLHPTAPQLQPTPDYWVDAHPVPGQPYFPWDKMGSVLPDIQGGRYLRPWWHQGPRDGQGQHTPAAGSAQGTSSGQGQGKAGAAGVHTAVGVQPGQAWDYQFPKRYVEAYVHRFEMMQGPQGVVGRADVESGGGGATAAAAGGARGVVAGAAAPTAAMGVAAGAAKVASSEPAAAAGVSEGRHKHAEAARAVTVEPAAGAHVPLETKEVAIAAGSVAVAAASGAAVAAMVTAESVSPSPGQAPNGLGAPTWPGAGAAAGAGAAMTAASADGGATAQTTN